MDFRGIDLLGTGLLAGVTSWACREEVSSKARKAVDARVFCKTNPRW